jgi:hypothetical protein
MWRSRDRLLPERELGGMRFLPGSPLEELLYLLRRRASAPSSVEVSEQEASVRRFGSLEEEEENEIDIRPGWERRMEVNGRGEAEAEAGGESRKISRN